MYGNVRQGSGVLPEIKERGGDLSLSNWRE